MKKLNITGKQLRSLGYAEGPVISVAMNTMNKEMKFMAEEEALVLLKEILNAPENYLEDEKLKPIAEKLIPKSKMEGDEIALKNSGIAFNIFGQEFIDEGALHQMYTAAKLPVAVAGALMPDAHKGYGLPIGGVLATENEIIPYAVGVDIGCRMCLSIFGIPPSDLEKKEYFFTRELNEATLFGSGAQFMRAENHAIMEHEAFQENKLLKDLQGRAWRQLGTSGSGNHFVEFGTVSISEKDEILGIEPGEYIGLLSHSGSRALGATIANHYTKIAINKRRLPADAKNLAWLSFNEEEGMEYWIAMNLAGDYASACHHIIHQKIAKQLGHKPISMVENHHNFAWKENFEGRNVIVHRKGATPAGKNVLGIIPGSMTASGYIVKGKGEMGSVNSASHGAGRTMSRSRALESDTQHQLNEVLAKHKVKLLGGGLDESPFAYKDIEMVMQSQKTLVDIVGKFTPKIVKMDGAAPKSWKKSRKMEGE